jgi:hypothetical protein
MRYALKSGFSNQLYTWLPTFKIGLELAFGVFSTYSDPSTLTFTATILFFSKEPDNCILSLAQVNSSRDHIIVATPVILRKKSFPFLKKSNLAGISLENDSTICEGLGIMNQIFPSSSTSVIRAICVGKLTSAFDSDINNAFSSSFIFSLKNANGISCIMFGSLTEYFNLHTKTGGSETECLTDWHMLFSSGFGIIFPEKDFSE